MVVVDIVSSIHICIQPQEDLVRDIEGMNWNSISENQVRWLESCFEEAGAGELIRQYQFAFKDKLLGIDVFTMLYF